MNKFIEVTRMNGHTLITINTDNIIYFRPSKLSSNKTEILVNDVKRPFIVEEFYEKVKSLIYPESLVYPEDSVKHNEINEFIEVTIFELSTDLTKVNGGISVTINTDDIIYFEQFSRNNKTEILVNGEKKPFVVEECYEDVKSKIYHPEDSTKYNEIK